MSLRPRLKTRVEGLGLVVLRDVTRFGLHRMVVALHERYPDPEPWLEMLNEGARPLAHHFSEKVVNQVFIGYLWLYWKE